MKNDNILGRGSDGTEIIEVFIMAKNATKDLTSGSPMQLILSFMLPLLFGLLFQQFYSMVAGIPRKITQM